MTAAVAVGDYEKAKGLVVVYLISSVIAFAVGSLGDLIGTHTENLVYGELLESYYRKLTSKDMSFYRDSHTGYLTSMFRQYLDNAILLIRFFRADVIRVLVSLTIPAVVLMAASWKIGLLTVLLIASQAVYVIWASAKAAKYREATSEIYRKISGEVADDLTNIVAYKSAGKEESALKHVMNLRKEETKAFLLRRRSSILLDFPRSIVTTVIVSAAFWLVLSTSTGTESSVGLLVLTLTYMFQIIRNVADLPDLIYRYDDYISKIEPTLETLDQTYETIQDKPDAVEFNPDKAAIEISNLGFKYGDNPKSSYIFKNFNLSIKGGEHVGVVGLSGAGKSTLANLLMRFDSLDSGTIMVDGIDINAVSQSSLRQKIAYVPQEPVLFHRSIRENIAYHNSEATDKDIIAAAKAAHAHEFISKLPERYETIVGERGVKLSGGQKQRVVIARAVLKNAPIVLFDEATSALDSESEHIIQTALPKIIGTHTAVIIAHRLSTVASLDRIIVMHNGAIEEEGTHQQLLKKRGRYYSLWKKQTNQSG